MFNLPDDDTHLVAEIARQKMAFQNVVPWMQPPAWHVHVIGAGCVVKLPWLAGEPCGMVRLDPCFTASLKEAAQAFVQGSPGAVKGPNRAPL
ncbi:hypothetical protein [Mycetohabitans rhizoxinica]|uniref:hypothetical protein n=1 Tax=Mycetohabitans rhizoxinica TaxID=412963 RepID=UPI00324623A7